MERTPAIAALYKQAADIAKHMGLKVGRGGGRRGARTEISPPAWASYPGRPWVPWERAPTPPTRSSTILLNCHGERRCWQS